MYSYTAQHPHRYRPNSSSLWERRPAREWSTIPDEGSKQRSNCRMFGGMTVCYVAVVTFRRARCIAAVPADKQGIGRFSGHNPRLGRTAGDANRHTPQEHNTRQRRKRMFLPWAWVQGTMLSPAALPTGRSADVRTGIKYNRDIMRNSSLLPA